VTIHWCESVGVTSLKAGEVRLIASREATYVPSF
jgi:hypothetical protein